MGTTGLIFAAIAVAWLAYLIPTYLRHRSPAAEIPDGTERFSDSMRIIRSGAAPLIDVDGGEISSVEVSTPLTRRAALAELRRQERAAAARRRRVLVVLAIALSAVIGVCAFELINWFWVAVPAALILGFVVVARFSVRAMRRHLDLRFARINDCGDEQTILMRRADIEIAVTGRNRKTPKAPADPARPEKTSTQALWDPLPIALPTYVSKPLTPRTVRTIDLSGPDVTSSGRRTALGSELPVTADAPLEIAPVARSQAVDDEQDETERRAAGA